jgi:hypothetical protein
VAAASTSQTIDIRSYPRLSPLSLSHPKIGDRIGVTARIEQDEYRKPDGGRQVDHTVLIDELDLA